jgi:hypothetical protein
MIADAVSSRSSKEDNNLIIFLETERMRAEERERVRVAEERVRQEERADERRRDEHRFQMQQQFQMQMMMLMMNPSRVPPPLLTPPLTQTSVNSSPSAPAQFDGQDFLERELLRRTSGV